MVEVNEKDHVNDIVNGVTQNLKYELMVFELVQGVAQCSTEDECRQENLKRLDAMVSEWGDNVMKESKERWDESGKHTLPRF